MAFTARDLTLKIGGSHEETIRIPNVLFVARKMKAIEKFTSVKPEAASAS